jgi:enolase
MTSRNDTITALEILDSRGFPTVRVTDALDGYDACEQATIERAGCVPRRNIAICLDTAASSFLENSKYHLTRSGQGDKSPAGI